MFPFRPNRHPARTRKSLPARERRVDFRRRRLAGERLERRDLLTGVSLTVTTLDDVVAADDALSLREAIELANAGGEAQQAFGRELTLSEQTSVSGETPFGDDVRIEFDAALFGESISVMEIPRQLEIRADMRIEGPGRDQLVIDAGPSEEVVASPEFEFDFTVIASDLSPDLRLFGSPNPADAPFTILRYGRGTLSTASDLPLVGEAIFQGGLDFTFGSDDPANPVEVATLSSFDDGVSDGVANQIYTPDGDDESGVVVSIGGQPFASGELLEVRLEVTPGSPPTTVSPESDPSRMRLTSLIDEERADLWDELMVATDGTGVIPFSLDEFNHDGSPIGFGDAAARFDSLGTSQLDPILGSRAFDVQGTEAESIDVALSGLTLRGGALRGSPSFSGDSVDGDDSEFDGGGLRSQDANLTLSGVRVADNQAFLGGGVHVSRGTLVVTDSEIMGNQAAFQSGAGGAISLESAEASVSRSLIAGNVAGYGGGISNYEGSVLVVRDSTLLENAADFDGGAIDNFEGSSATLINTTVSGNRAERGGGIWNGSTTSLHVINSTIVANLGEVLAEFAGEFEVPGGGIYTADGSSGDATGTATLLENTIVAGNTGRLIDGTIVPADLVGTVDPSSSHNLIGDSASAGGLEDGIRGNRVGDAGGSGVLPLEEILDPIPRDNGGGVLTHTLVDGSPAIDAGADPLAVVPGDPPVPLAHDQRGIGFDRIIAASVDIGSVEWVANVPAWQNPADPVDVNDSGGVSGLDALLIINFLSRSSGEVDLNGIERGPQDDYYDVSGDNRVTARDALLVINEFARRLRGGGEAESAPAWGPPPSTLWSAIDDDDDERLTRWLDAALAVWDD